MATESEVRLIVSDLTLHLERLRQYSPAIPAEFDAAQQQLSALLSEIPQDVLGGRASTWSAVPPAEQGELLKRLKTIKDTLNSLESQVRAPSKKERRWLLSYAVAVPLALLIPLSLCVCKGAVSTIVIVGSDDMELHITTEGAGLGTDEATGEPSETTSEPGQTTDESGPKTRKLEKLHTAWVCLLIISLGAFGGSIRLISSLVLYMGEDKLYRSWLFYYYLMPLEGLGLAAIAALLFAAGILTPTNGAGQSTLLFLYAIAGFTGLFAKNVAKKLQDLADILFAKPSQKDTV